MMMYDMTMGFHARSISMHMGLNRTGHMYTVTTGLYMIIYMVSCLDILVYLCFPEVVDYLYMCIAEYYDIYMVSYLDVHVYLCSLKL
jgi:dolichol kinase